MVVKFSSRDQVPPGRSRSLQPHRRSVFFCVNTCFRQGVLRRRFRQPLIGVRQTLGGPSAVFRNIPWSSPRFAYARAKESARRVGRSGPMGYPQDPRYQGRPPETPPAYQSWSGHPPSQHGSYLPPPPTNGTAIAALVFALLFAPVGIVLGHIARGQIKRTGEGGRGLATAALIIGWRCRR
jgi:Domain of unknown function (DUF4190)